MRSFGDLSVPLHNKTQVSGKGLTTSIQNAKIPLWETSWGDIRVKYLPLIFTLLEKKIIDAVQKYGYTQSGGSGLGLKREMLEVFWPAWQGKSEKSWGMV